MPKKGVSESLGVMSPAPPDALRWVAAFLSMIGYLPDNDLVSRRLLARVSYAVLDDDFAYSGQSASTFGTPGGSSGRSRSGKPAYGLQAAFFQGPDSCGYRDDARRYRDRSGGSPRGWGSVANSMSIVNAAYHYYFNLALWSRGEKHYGSSSGQSQPGFLRRSPL